MGSAGPLGCIWVADDYENRQRVRAQVERAAANELVLSDPFAAHTVRTVRLTFLRDAANNTTQQSAGAYTARIGGVGKLAFSQSVTDPIVYPEDNSGRAPKRELLFSNPQADTRLAAGGKGCTARVDNNREGFVEHSFEFSEEELLKPPPQNLPPLASPPISTPEQATDVVRLVDKLRGIAGPASSLSIRGLDDQGERRSRALPAVQVGPRGSMVGGGRRAR